MRGRMVKEGRFVDVAREPRLEDFGGTFVFPDDMGDGHARSSGSKRFNETDELLPGLRSAPGLALARGCDEDVATEPWERDPDRPGYVDAGDLAVSGMLNTEAYIEGSRVSVQYDRIAAAARTRNAGERVLVIRRPDQPAARVVTVLYEGQDTLTVEQFVALAAAARERITAASKQVIRRRVTEVQATA